MSNYTYWSDSKYCSALRNGADTAVCIELIKKIIIGNKEAFQGLPYQLALDGASTVRFAYQKEKLKISANQWQCILKVTAIRPKKWFYSLSIKVFGCTTDSQIQPLIVLWAQLLKLCTTSAITRLMRQSHTG